MALLRVLTHPDPRLRIVAERVTDFGEAFQTFVDDLVETMYAEVGRGLAAPQVGASLRVVVIDLRRPDEGGKLVPGDVFVLANPEITSREGEIVWREGCLSLPGIAAEVLRTEHLKLRYQDRLGEHRVLEARDLFAVCIQHELDHLDGTLYVDRLGPLERALALQDYVGAQHRAGRQAPPA